MPHASFRASLYAVAACVILFAHLFQTYDGSTCLCTALVPGIEALVSLPRATSEDCPSVSTKKWFQLYFEETEVL